LILAQKAEKTSHSGKVCTTTTLNLFSGQSFINLKAAFTPNNTI
jgi:hypothetical protein